MSWGPRRTRRSGAGRRVAVSAIAMVGAMGLALTAAASEPRQAPLTPAESCQSVPLTAQERRVIFDALKSDDDPTEAPEAAFDDATLTATLQRYAVTLLGLRTRPSEVDRLWTIEPRPRDVAAELQQARGEGRLSAWLGALDPPHADYRALRSAGCRYRLIVDAGGWSPLPTGPTLREEDTDPSIEALRRRLAIEGYRLGEAAAPQRFDAVLVGAVRDFQLRHDLAVDGVLGPETRRMLDIPAEDRLAQIEANLERWRWLPHDLPADRIELDIGAAEATLFRSGQPHLRMRAIVGAPNHKTPMFQSQVEAVVFNPPWNVPSSIARNEILPRAARDPGYLARNGFVRTPQGLQQRPGPKNALGQVKFDLPSPFGVYLHDTPGRASFARRVRTLSHGCMRLEMPRELAHELLARQGWDLSEIDQAIATGTTRRVGLQAPVPLFVIYRTAAVDPDGWVSFGRDAYGWDGKLLAALAGAGRDPSDPPHEAECSGSVRP